MTAPRKHLQIASAPHVHAGHSVPALMRQVLWALLPAAAWGVYVFGWAGLLVLGTATLSCMACEYLLCRIAKRASTLHDGSVAITGLIYGMTLPANLPLWMVALGAVFAVAVGKALFGGLGQNLFNPALVGRAFLQAAFPGAMTTWQAPLAVERFSSVPTSTFALPFASPVYDATSAATPLAAFKFEHVAGDVWNLFFGFSGGSVGETSALLLLSGGVYLMARRCMDWRIPAGVFAAVGMLSVVLPMSGAAAASPGPWFMLFSGGLMLGALFMATDPVASPVTHAGGLLYGVLIGVLVVVIRLWGGMPEGVMYAILLANAVSPHIDRWIQPRPFGGPRRGADS
jgi:electron transport complex protein RnfD